MTDPVLFFVDDLAEGIAAPALRFHQADPGAAQIPVMNLGPTRGDGIFEAISVVDGHIQAFDAHLRRFARSARLLDLPAPKLAVWRDAIRTAVAAHRPVPEAYAKVIVTRGTEDAPDLPPLGWVYVDEVDREAQIRARTRGIRVVLLSRGYRHDIAQTSPWLLQGAKTLSYAVNQSALRWALGHGADDAVFTSTDGLVLEGPHASLVLKRGDTIATPTPDQGILQGTTQLSAFEFFASAGLRTEYRHVAVDELADADALWLVSSIRQAAPIVAIDGTAHATDRELTDRLNAYLLARTA